MEFKDCWQAKELCKKYDPEAKVTTFENQNYFARALIKAFNDGHVKRVGVCKVCGKTGSNYACNAYYREASATLSTDNKGGQ